MKETALCCNSLCPSRRLGRSPDGATSFRPATRVHLQQSHEGFHAYWCLSNLINAWCVCHNSTHKHCQRINLHPLASCEHVSSISIDSLGWLRCLTWLQFVLLIRLQSVCQRVSGATMESGGGICHGYSDWIGVIDFDGLAVWLRVTSYDFVWLRGFAASSIPFRKVSQGFGSLFGYFCSSLLETLLLGRLSDHPELRPSKLWRSCRSCEGRAAKACRAKLPERLWLVTCTHLFAVPLKFVILEDQHFFIAIKQHPLGSLWSTLRNEERPFTLSGPSWQN